MQRLLKKDLYHALCLVKMKILCPNCNVGLPIKLSGDVRIAYCSKCGFEMAVDREDPTKQTKIFNWE